MSTLKKAIELLSVEERRQGLYVLFLVMGMALLETVGVASVMPFLAVLGSPEIIETNPILHAVFVRADSFGITTSDQFVIVLGAFAFCLMLVSAGYRTITQYCMNQYIEMLRHSVGVRLLKHYLRQPYEFFLGRHSGDMSKSILSEVDQLVVYVYRPLCSMVSYCLVLVVMIALLILINPWVAVLSVGFLGILNGLFFLLLRKKLALLGDRIVVADKERFMAAGEALGGIKDIKLLGREHAYLSRFFDPSKSFATSHAIHQTLNQVPYYLIEVIAIGGILLISIILISQSGGINSGSLGVILPALGLYAFAAYRLKPAVTNIFQGFTSLRFGRAIVNSLYSEMHLHDAPIVTLKTNTGQIKARYSIELEDITYFYPGTIKPAIKNMRLSIPVGSSLGLVGSTGAGKTTVVDIVLGLLHPTQGSICVDGELVSNQNLHTWQQSLGYVPQEIFFTDTSVSENIAFGVPKNEIDFEQVMRCADMAQIHDFIVKELPERYDTLLGERGVRLSGGQRQRIGIARALYHNPEVLVFDEATSALDNITERAVMEAIDALVKKKKTIILIAHRLSTVRNCDQIVLIERGIIKAIGNFQELTRGSEQFRSMAD
jgi:ABC-type multidrug transport system fused ATPase/permease subunit